MLLTPHKLRRRLKSSIPKHLSSIGTVELIGEKFNPSHTVQPNIVQIIVEIQAVTKNSKYVTLHFGENDLCLKCV